MVRTFEVFHFMGQDGIFSGEFVINNVWLCFNSAKENMPKNFLLKLFPRHRIERSIKPFLQVFIEFPAFHDAFILLLFRFIAIIQTKQKKRLTIPYINFNKWLVVPSQKLVKDPWG